MFAVDRLILLAGVLLLLGIASSKFSSRVGLPVLVLFLAVGMLAGSEGIGGIEFEDYTLAHGVGTLALALILFDGGLRTPLSAFRVAVRPAVTLAVPGVLVTALVTGAAAAAILDISLLEGILLGSIVGSTDAAAVFSVLRSKGVHIRERLAATLEIESGSNDPMAVFLTVGCLEVLLGRVAPGLQLLWLFVVQMAVGGLVGLAVGRVTVSLVNRIDLDAAGLYPVFTSASAALAYGLAASLGGSGFLAVYLAGIVMGNSRLVFQRAIFVFHDGLAWLGQILMFVLLGLLSFPSRLGDVAQEGLLVAAVLILVARPLAVVACLLPFRYSPRELAFVSWVGLKGAVPIILATYPFLLGFAQAPLLFNVVFFVVLVSAVTQGWTLPPLARALRLQVPPEPEPPVSLEISSVKDVDGDIVEYNVGPDCRAAGRRVRELAMPDGAVVAMVAREHRVIPPRGSTRIEPGDHVFVVLRPEVRPLVDRIFSHAKAVEEVPPLMEFPLRGSTTVGELEEFYGVRIDAARSKTLDEVMREWLGESLAAGSSVEVGEIVLSAREVVDGRVERVGMAIRPAPEEAEGDGGETGTPPA